MGSFSVSSLSPLKTLGTHSTLHTELLKGQWDRGSSQKPELRHLPSFSWEKRKNTHTHRHITANQLFLNGMSAGPAFSQSQHLTSVQTHTHQSSTTTPSAAHSCRHVYLDYSWWCFGLFWLRLHVQTNSQTYWWYMLCEYDCILLQHCNALLVCPQLIWTQIEVETF